MGFEKEGANVEFKREFTADLKKEIVAFANTSGGVIYIGIQDDGGICGVPDGDETLLQITNSARDSILPDITMFLDYKIDNDIIKITVQEGVNKPYYLKDKGIKPSGIYIRQGASSAQASHEMIRQMIKQSDGDKYEQLRALTQDLTFEAATDEFEKRQVEFGENQMRTLGIKGADGLFTNLGLLLSDQCTHTIKVACFNGNEKGEFKTRKEFEGSILKQLYEAFAFIELSNNLNATFSGLDRIESYDYPQDVLREALLNAIVHREYSFSGSIIVNIYDNRMEFVSLGGLVQGLSESDLTSGISQPRNEKLANVFYRLKHIEAYGTGIKRIMDCYKDQPLKPLIKTTEGTFVMEVPNMNVMKENKQSQTGKLKKQHKLILNFLEKNHSITNEQIQNLLAVKQTRAYGIIREMEDAGLIERGETASYVAK